MALYTSHILLYSSSLSDIQNSRKNSLYLYLFLYISAKKGSLHVSRSFEISVCVYVEWMEMCVYYV